MYSESIQKLIDLFSKFPTIGPRTAARFVFYLIKSKPEKRQELIKAISELEEKIKICDFCGKPYEKSQGSNGLCEICSNKTRDASLLCIVEKEEDLEAIEKTNKYKGLYFILGGAVSNFEKRRKQIEDRFEKLTSFLGGLNRNLNGNLNGKMNLHPGSNSYDRRNLNKGGFSEETKEEVKEIILALNPTPEGENTALWLERKLKPLNIKISRLGRGLPKGGELEYADEETLSSALESRR